MQARISSKSSLYVAVSEANPHSQGRNCQEDIDDCADQPCRNGATCEDRVNEYFCECTSGWSGLTCETKINECDFNPCYNGGRCQTLDTGYQCDCRPGFTGKFFNLKNVSVYYYV